MTARATRSTMRLAARVSSLVDSRHTVAVAALAAALLRLPGVTQSIFPDEAGFLLVARSWHPQPDSMFGLYWVDRPPLIIAVVKASDAVGGPHFLRLVGALACGLLVLAAAQVARLVAGERAARWTAVAVAAIVGNALIDPVGVKGELLALPLIMGSFWLTLLALRRTSAPLALASGLVATLAVGLKQNLVAGLVFAAVVLVASRLTGRITGRQFLRLAGAGLVGAAVPVLGTVAWAMAAGVRLPTLWYAVYGFRSDASRVISEGSTAAPTARTLELVVVALAVGMLLIIGGFLVHIRSAWGHDKVITAATLAVLVIDGAGLVAGGSYWIDYLFPLVPGTALCAALMSASDAPRGQAMRVVIAAAAVSTVVCMVGWIAVAVTGGPSHSTATTGEAIGAVAEPHDTLTVFGGRADLQYASGLSSPYRFLWSLPMRTLDPDYAELRRLVTGPDAPTWLVEVIPFTSWGNPSAGLLEDAVRLRYVEHGLGCDDRPIFLLRGVDRPIPEPVCS